MCFCSLSTRWLWLCAVAVYKVFLCYELCLWVVCVEPGTSMGFWGCGISSSPRPRAAVTPGITGRNAPPAPVGPWGLVGGTARALAPLQSGRTAAKIPHARKCACVASLCVVSRPPQQPPRIGDGRAPRPESRALTLHWPRAPKKTDSFGSKSQMK